MRRSMIGFNAITAEDQKHLVSLLFSCLLTPSVFAQHFVSNKGMYPSDTGRVETLLTITPNAPSTFCDSLLIKKYAGNKGEGIYNFKGIRNLRTVLPGVLYRSGGNNVYHPLVRRHNYNPLSFQTIVNLWEMGFDDILYLYNTRFDSLYAGELNGYLRNMGIRYSSMQPTKEWQIRALLKRIHGHINNPSSGYMLIHCWNGWHMSGLIAAYALMQFCGYDSDAAWKYWKNCTDGSHRGYEKLRTRIRAFKPYSDLILTAEQKKLNCPCEHS